MSVSGNIDVGKRNLKSTDAIDIQSIKTRECPQRSTIELYDRLVPTNKSVNDMSSHDSVRVLVVDDSVMNRKMMIRLLMSSHHRCVCDEAAHGADACDKIKHTVGSLNSFDLILIDYQMPVMDGPTAIREIKKMGFNGRIVGVTGNALPEDISVMVESGADKVLVKPIDASELDYVIGGTCDISER